MEKSVSAKQTEANLILFSLAETDFGYLRCTKRLSNSKRLLMHAELSKGRYGQNQKEEIEMNE